MDNNSNIPDTNEDQAEPKDGLQEKVRHVVRELILPDNEPQFCRELVTLGQGKNIARFRQCLAEEKELIKQRVSEIICILEAPEIAQAFVDKKMTFREACPAARAARAANREGKNHHAPKKKKKTTSPPTKLLEEALLDLARKIAGAGHLGCHTIELQAYQLTYQPITPPAPTTALEQPAITPEIIALP
ncbi:MAG: hypothetical protein ABSH48_13470 [Verrucomicrobiota bacterium]|jgi:hypothetical protein